MAQSIVLKAEAKARNNDSFVCHYSSHLLLNENNGYSELLNMTPIVIPRVDDIEFQQPICSFDVITTIERFNFRKINDF